MAARFWIGGGTTTAWSASPTTNWSATSGGAVRVAAPTSSDDVTFDGAGASGNSVSVVTANAACLSLTFTSGYTSTITINSTTNITISGSFTDNTAHTWVVNSVVSGVLTINAASTITSGGKTFPGNVTISGANTKTLSGDWTITGTLSASGGSQTCNSNTINCAGFGATTALTGTTTINITGGVWSGAGTVNMAITISGNVTLFTTPGSYPAIGGASASLTYLSGTVTTTNSTLTIAGSCTLNTNGISFNIIVITLSAGITITNNSLLTVTGTMSFPTNFSVIFAGTSGWIVGTFSSANTGTVTYTLLNTVTYTITTSFQCASSRSGSLVLFTSDHATNKAILTLTNASTICYVLASFTRIDAGNGRPINTFNGVITTCINVYAYTNINPSPIKSFDRGIGRNFASNKSRSVTFN